MHRNKTIERKCRWLWAGLAVAWTLNAAGNPVTVDWKNWDNHIYDAAGVDHRADGWLFQLVLDPRGDTAVSAMVSNRTWRIGAEDAGTPAYGADDDVTLPEQNANWQYNPDYDWGLVGTLSSYEGTNFGNTRFYIRFFNAAATNDATEAGLIYHPGGAWHTVPDTDPPALVQAAADIGRMGTEAGSIAGSTDGLNADGWATMAAPAPVEHALTIVSAFAGVTPPPGPHLFLHGTDLVCAATSSPIFAGVQATQYVCVGWTGSGSVTNGAGTEAAIRLTNDSTLVWLWTTNYWLDVQAGPSGSVIASTGWCAAATTVEVQAVAAAYYHFAGWTGSVAALDNPLALPMDRPYALGADFAVNLTTNATPEWWLAAHGLTNLTWAEEALDDRDRDGAKAWEECVAGTDPTNAASRLAVERLRAGTGGLALRWPCVAGRRYRVLARDSLASPTWVAASGYLDATGGVDYLDSTVPFDPGRAARYYRIEVTPFE